MSEQNPKPTIADAYLASALETLQEQVGIPDFGDAATSIVRDPAGKVQAMACAATGWRAAWLVEVMRLLEGATERALEDLKNKNAADFDDVVERIAKPKHPGEEA